jgi:hypothetical protein
MRERLLDHIKNCQRCRVLLKHPANSALHLLAHLVDHRFSEADAHHAVRWVYDQIDKLRRSEAH